MAKTKQTARKVVKSKARRGVTMPVRAATARKAPAGAVKKKTRKMARGRKTLFEIRRLQKNTDLLIAKAPFARLVKEIMQDVRRASDVTRIAGSALSALQEAAEDHIVELFELSQLAAFHAKRITVMDKDMKLINRVRGVRFTK